MRKFDHDHMQEIVLKEEADIFSDPNYQAYRRNWTEYPKRFFVSNYPINLDIHVTNRCNLRCVMCSRTLKVERGLLGKTGFLDFDLYKTIVDEAALEGCCAVHLTGYGEPLLHNQIVEMVEYAHRKKIMDVFMHTNATLLTREISQELLGAGLTRLIISFDSPVAETYESIRRGAKFEEVLNNIRMFAGLKKKNNLSYPLVRIQMVDMKVNENERELFDKLFGTLADSLGHVSYINYMGLDKEERSIEQKQYRQDFICPQPWQRLTVEWNGRVYACLLVNEDLYLGHIKETSIKNMWHSTKMNGLRKRHREGSFSSIAACEECGRQYKA